MERVKLIDPTTGENLSSNLAEIGHDPATNQLEAQFHSGRVYRYQNVPTELFHAILAADSIGGYFNAEIVKQPEKYPFERLPDVVATAAK